MYDAKNKERHGPGACGKEQGKAPLHFGELPALCRVSLNHGLREQRPGVLKVADHYHADEGGP